MWFKVCTCITPREGMQDEQEAQIGDMLMCIAKPKPDVMEKVCCFGSMLVLL